MEDYNVTICINNTSKIQWACRRGMLELDVILGNFLTEAYSSLTLTDKRLFVELLDYSDPELFVWLIGREPPEDIKLARITGIIQNHARSRI